MSRWRILLAVFLGLLSILVQIPPYTTPIGKMFGAFGAFFFVLVAIAMAQEDGLHSNSLSASHSSASRDNSPQSELTDSQ